MMKKQQASTSYLAWKKIRNDWGEICPITKVILNKKKNPKIKHKNREVE